MPGIEIKLEQPSRIQDSGHAGEYLPQFPGFEDVVERVEMTGSQFGALLQLELADILESPANPIRFPARFLQHCRGTVHSDDGPAAPPGPRYGGVSRAARQIHESARVRTRRFRSAIILRSDSLYRDLRAARCSSTCSMIPRSSSTGTAFSARR